MIISSFLLYGTYKNPLGKYTFPLAREEISSTWRENPFLPYSSDVGVGMGPGGRRNCTAVPSDLVNLLIIAKRISQTT